LTGALLLSLRYPSVQTYFAQKATEFLSKKLNAKVSIEKVRIVFFDEIELVNFYMEDLEHDTLIYAEELNIDIKAFELFDKTLNIQEVNLKSAKVHLKRDSLGAGTNISRLFSVFKSNAVKDTSSTPLKWKIDLRTVNLSETDVRYLDKKTNLDLRVYVPSCVIDLDKVQLQNKFIGINSAVISGADVNIQLLKRSIKKQEDSLTEVHFLKNVLKIEWKKFALLNAHFSLNDLNSDSIKPAGIDFKHLDISNINVTTTEGAIVDDTIFANLQSLTARDRSGLEVEELSAQARVSVRDITLQQFHLKTPHSEIGNFLSFRYSHFREFKKFLDGVKMDVRLTDSKFSLKDLSYFIKGMERVAHNTFKVSGRFKGSVSELDGRNIEIKTAANTYFAGDFSTHGLPNIFETSLNVRVRRMSTTAMDVKSIYPAVKLPPNLNTLGMVRYTGTFDGFVTDFVSNGKLETQIGSAITDVNFAYNKATNKSAYQGNLSLHNFDLGKYFYDEKNFGTVSLQTKIKGGGLTLESLRAELEGKVSSITLLNHQYTDIAINGFVLKKSFNGDLHLNDDNLKMDFDGRVDLSKEIPEFKFNADVKYINFKALNILKNDFRISGKVKSDFAGLKIDDILGRVDVSNVILTRDTIESFVNYASIDVKSLPGAKKLFEIKSDFLEGEVDGNFNYKDLPKAFIRFAKETFTRDYLDTATIANQDFHFDIRIFEPRDFTRIIHPDFKVIRNSHIEGDFSTKNQFVNLTGYIPEVQFGKFKAKTVDLEANAESGFFDFEMNVDRVYNGDSLWIDTLQVLTQTTANKDFRFDLLVADKRKFNYANITAFITPKTDKTLIRLEPSDVKLANYNWHFDPGNAIFVQGKKITSQGLVFRSAEQKIYVDSYLRNDTSTSVKLTLDNTSISDFTGIFTTKMRDLIGTVNGKLTVEDVFYKPRVFADFVVNEFYLGNQLIGDINIESRLDETGKKLLVYSSIKSVNNYLEAKGYVSLDPTKPDINIDVNAPKLGLNFLNYKFFERYVKDVRGTAIVKANVYGTLSKPLLGGEVTLVNDTVTVSFLNTTYHINNQRVKLDNKGFDFGNLTAYDVRDKMLVASGRINHESFKKWELACGVVSEDAQFLNTNEKLSPYFYGIVFGKGSVSFNGPFNSPVIKAYAMTQPGSYCRLPIRSSYETNKYSFYKFSTGQDSISRTPQNQLKLNGVTFQLDLDVTPDARMDIILDPVTGDILTTYGRGNLKIEIPKVGNISMYGTYEIERGSYLFTLQNIINKRFDITRGGTINFGGDIYKAGLNVDAVYEVRTSMTDLISDLISESGNTQSQLAAAARTRVPTRLALKLTGVLERPTIGFDIRAIDPDPAIKSYVEQKLAILKTNDNEMNKQVFGLLVMNRFLPQSPFGNAVANTNLGGTAANTVSEFVSSQLSNYLSSLLGYANVNNLDINIDYRQYDQASGTTANPNATNDIRRELQLELSQRFLNNRLSINAGGNIDFGNSQVVQGGSTSRSVIPTGDFQIEYALTKDGVWRAKAFNRTNYDYYNSRNNNRTGLGISFRKEFDKPSELLIKKKEKKKKKEAVK
jgi:hypothetical protein